MKTSNAVIAPKRTFSDDIDLRHPYYEACDSATALLFAAIQLADVELENKCSDVIEALNAVQNYMDAALVWD